MLGSPPQSLHPGCSLLLASILHVPGDMEEVDTQELPIIAAALTDLEYRDPFLLTVLAGKQLM